MKPSREDIISEINDCLSEKPPGYLDDHESGWYIALEYIKGYAETGECPW